MSQPETTDDAATKEPKEGDKDAYFREYNDVINWKLPATDESKIPPFDTGKAWDALLQLASCQEMMIREENQKKLNIVVGVNVTQEFPWKHVTCRNLREYLFDDLSNGQMFYNALMGFDPDSYILVGYIPILTQSMDDPPEGDPFIMFINPDDAKIALAIIRNMETSDRLCIEQRIIRKPRAWVSFGSEHEVNLTIAQRYHEPINVEIQSVYPLTIPADKEFTFRFTKDVRDGYVELTPKENAQFDNVARRRITVGIQSSCARNNIEQQTDPTFPTNAWAQYIYEVDDGDDCLDDITDDEQTTDKGVVRKSTTPEPPKEPKPPPNLSDNVKFLLSILEFNQIDMYRNDYPLISNMSISYHSTPNPEESISFAAISKSQNRFVCSCDWYPTLSGLIVSSYTFITLSTTESVYNKPDTIQRSVLERNPVLMWSFSDNLHYKLEFESSFEVTFISFCPYDANILIGGCSNGQVIIWDIQNRVDKLDWEEVLTSNQIHYRIVMNDFLKWTLPVNEETVLSPVAISALENSSNGPITGIHWLGRGYFVNSFGKIYQDSNSKEKYRYFLTSALDGSISFWNLDVHKGKAQSSYGHRDLPKALKQNESSFKGVILTPIFTVASNIPLSAIIADTPTFKCELNNTQTMPTNRYSNRTEMKAVELSTVRQCVLTASLLGRVSSVEWLGTYSDTDACEAVNSGFDFAHVHDGPIVAMKRNNFIPSLFISIGRCIFAIWNDDYKYSPIVWRKRKTALTSVTWSETRPSVFFLARIDGSIEVWDLYSRDDEACLDDIIGGGIVTYVCEHKISEPEKLIGIGDYNSTLKMLKLPRVFYIGPAQEKEMLQDYIAKEKQRKVNMQEWELKYIERNKETVDAKLMAEKEAHKQIERLEKEAMLNAARKAKEEENLKNEAMEKAHLSYTELMKQQWYDLNLNRLLNILMSRKRVNERQLMEDTIREKERLAYEEAKKQAIARVLQNVADEVAKIRLQILPIEIPDYQRTDGINESIDLIFNEAPLYSEIEEEANSILENIGSLDIIDFPEFLDRGVKRRQYVNKSLGGNLERSHWYETMREYNLLTECNWGFDLFPDLLAIADELEAPRSEHVSVENLNIDI